MLDAAATLGNWSLPLASGRARGIAIGAAFNSIVATVVEVSGTSTTAFRIQRVSLAIDCTRVVNPAHVEAQLTGGVVHGINAALYGRRTFVGGAAQKRNFNSNRMIRLGDMPTVAVTLVQRTDAVDRTTPIGGVGELGVPTLAPALVNAVARLTGQRLRTLPLFPMA